MFFSFRYQDQDAQSDTGSERSVTPAAFVATTQPHPAHHQTPQGIPYHMHHSLIQHLTDMRDLYGSHQSITGISNHHNSNWKMRIIFFMKIKILWRLFYDTYLGLEYYWFISLKIFVIIEWFDKLRTSIAVRVIWIFFSKNYNFYTKTSIWFRFILYSDVIYFSLVKLNCLLREKLYFLTTFFFCISFKISQLNFSVLFFSPYTKLQLL